MAIGKGMGPRGEWGSPGSDRSNLAESRESNETLMERIGDGDRDSLRTLFERYWSALVEYATGIVGGPDQAHDVVQDSFIRVWQKREAWVPRGSVEAYLYRIVRNLSLNAHRDRRNATYRHDHFVRESARETPPETPTDVLEASFLRTEINVAIAALPDRRREVFVLSRFHGLTHREIAATMEISPQTVSNQMTAALTALREALSHLMDEE